MNSLILKLGPYFVIIVLALILAMSVTTCNSWKDKALTPPKFSTVEVIKIDTFIKHIKGEKEFAWLKPDSVIINNDTSTQSECDSTRYYTSSVQDSTVDIEVMTEVDGVMVNQKIIYDVKVREIVKTIERTISIPFEVPMWRTGLYVGPSALIDSADFRLGVGLNLVTKDRLSYEFTYYPSGNFRNSTKELSVKFRIFGNK